MKRIKKVLSLLLCVCMCIMILPVFSFAFPERYEEGPYTYYIESGYAVICDYDHSVSGELVIPKKLGGYQVVGISDWKFQRDEKITSVVLPDGFLFLGELAFADCKNLKNITIPDSLCGVSRGVLWDTPWYDAQPKDDYFYIGNVLAEIKEGFYPTELIVKDGTTGIAEYLCLDNKNLTKVVLPESCNIIGEYAFSGCAALKEICMPEEMIYIGNYAFGYCSQLERVELPTGIKTVYNGLFADNTSLKEVIIPESVRTIEHGAFGGCTSLSSVVLPESVEKLSIRSFIGCTGLKEITIPVTMKFIDDLAFLDCDALEKLIFNGTDEQYSSIVIMPDGNESLLKLKSQSREMQENIPYIPYFGEAVNTHIPRGTSVADYYDTYLTSSLRELGRFVAPSLVEKGFSNVLIGDTDNNGTVDAADARAALRSSVGLEKVDFTRMYTADIDNDKKITAADARSILRASVNLEDSSLWI